MIKNQNAVLVFVCWYWVCSGVVCISVKYGISLDISLMPPILILENNVLKPRHQIEDI